MREIIVVFGEGEKWYDTMGLVPEGGWCGELWGVRPGHL